MIVLSHFQAAPLLHAHQAGQSSASLSTDLGLTTTAVELQPGGAVFPTGERLPWSGLEAIADNALVCFAIENGAPRAIRAFSELTGRAYSLLPTASAPTMLVSGFPMHRIKGTNPHLDTLSKIKAIAPVGGNVLDTTTGLGYTAIEAAKTAAHVTTVELDPAAQDIARQNPWSRALFDNPAITQLIGDSFDVIEAFEAESFSCLLHDPPTFSLAGDLYSGAFYQQAHRVLKRHGRMFHYIGDPDSAAGARVTKGVIRRLKEAGFTRITPAPQAFGVVAHKSAPRL